MLQPTVVGSVVGGGGSVVGAIPVGSPRTSILIGGGGGPHEEELLPLSSSGIIPIEQEERVGLLDDSRQPLSQQAVQQGQQEGEGESPSVQQRSVASKRQHSTKEKRRMKGHSSSHADGWNMRENFLWLWGGSAYSGVLCMLASALCYSLMGLLVRLLAVHSIPAYETVAVRCAVIAALAAVGLSRTGHPLLGSPNLRPLLVARALVGFLAVSAFFYSIRVLPLRDATVLSFTAPAFTAIVASIFLDEKFGSREIAGTACSLLGILMVNQPPLIFGGRAVLPDIAAESATAAAAGARHESVVAVLAALVSAGLAGVAYCLVRALGKAGEPTLAVVFMFAAVSCPASLLCLLLFQEFVVPTVVELAGMLLVGAVAFAAQVFLTRSLQLEKAGKATAMQYAKAVGTHALAVLFLGEAASLKAVVGSVLIGASIAFIVLADKHDLPAVRALAALSAADDRA